MTRLNGRQIISLAHRVLLAGAMFALFYLALQLVLAFRGEGLAAHSRLSPAFIWFGGAVYIFGHGLRSLRLALLIGGWRVGLRQIVSFHFFTASVSLAAPLKLGELYRVAELSSLLGDAIRAVATVWWERLFDVVAIIVIMVFVVLYATDSNWQQFIGVSVVAVGFVIITSLTFFVLPDNLRRLSVLIIRRYESPRSVEILRVLDLFRRAILGAPRLVRAKFASLVALTTLIWACELTCFAIVLRAVGGALSSAPDALLGFLSVITQGYTLLAALQSDSQVSDLSVATYLTVTQMPLVFAGLFWGLYYVAHQARWRRLQFGLA
jgi:hypothetical protein